MLLGNGERTVENFLQLLSGEEFLVLSVPSGDYSSSGSSHLGGKALCCSKVTTIKY